MCFAPSNRHDRQGTSRAYRNILLNSPWSQEETITKKESRLNEWRPKITSSSDWIGKWIEFLQHIFCQNISLSWGTVLRKLHRHSTFVSLNYIELLIVIWTSSVGESRQPLAGVVCFGQSSFFKMYERKNLEFFK